MAQRPHAWWVYMLECDGGRLYTGVTPDVERRFAAHCAGRGAAYTRMYKPVRVAARMRCASRGAALKAEHRLKALTRAEKLAWLVRRAAAAARGARTARRAARSVPRQPAR